MAAFIPISSEIRMRNLIGITIPASSTEKIGNLAPSSHFHREGRWDHTYVVSSEGHRWGCFGRSDGGHEICRGIGDVDKASHLACGNGKAGIHYLVTGVCHQSANRILYPADILVSKARGYTFSSSIYGEYGLGRWSQLELWLRTQDDITGYDSGPPGLAEDAAPFLYFPSIPGLEEPNPMSPLLGKYQNDPRRKAFLKAINDRLGTDYNREKRRGLLDAQLESFTAQDELVESFQNNRLSAEDYFAQLTILTRKCLSKYETILDREDFVKLFDFPPDEVPPPGDPEIFAQAQGLSKPPKLPD